MFSCIIAVVFSILYGTLVHLNAINGTGMPVNYSWTASNGNKFTNVIEVLEDHTYADDLDMNNIGNTAKGKYTWKNEWYVNKDGSGSKIDYGVDKPDGNDITLYGKWVSTITYNNNGLGSKPANKEIIKGQQITAAGLPTLTGNPYTFRGWCSKNPTSSGDAVLKASWVPTGNQTIYCKWVSVVTFQGSTESGGGTISTSRPGRNDTVEVIKGGSTNSGDPGGFYSPIFGTSTQYYWKLQAGVGASEIGYNTDFVPKGNATYVRANPNIKMG